MNKKPNIIFILSDDQGAWAMHCAGTPELYTPNLDRLAARGTRFDSFFCASPVCSPARASILTGTIPSAHGVHDWLVSGNLDKDKIKDLHVPYGDVKEEDKPIQYLKGKVTYTDVLAEHGYQCAITGKWHLGDSMTPQHGYKKWYVLGRGGCNYFYPDVIEDGKIELKQGEYVTDLVTDRALGLIDELSGGEDPFYLDVHYTAPHSPWGPEHHHPEDIARYQDCPFDSIPDIPDHPDMTTGPVYGTPRRRTNLVGYFAAITAMDRNIGRILDRLEEKGMAENTIVIFTADNGMSMGHHGIWGKGNGTFPQNMYDTAVKVPFIISWPDHFPEGEVCCKMVSAYDLFPTFLDLLDLPSHACEKLPGKSFLPLLQGGNLADRTGDVVIFDEYGPVRMIRTSQYKYIHRYPYGYNEFYDLEQDPGEEHNLIDDPAFEPVILELRRRMEKWFESYVNPDIDGTKEGVTGGGQRCSAGIYAEKLRRYNPM